MGKQELRLALSMKGGVSLAVWIGGAVSEINRLRIATDGGSDHGAHPWARLADLAGYRRVRVDVLTGASAGGLNGAIMAASLVYGFPFQAMRELWVQMADIEALCRPTHWQRGTPGAAPSVLEGDDYFYGSLNRVLGHLVSLPPSTPRVSRVDLLLTATLERPAQVIRRDDRSGLFSEERRRAYFRFRHSGHPGDRLSDFRGGSDAQVTAAQLALAARATSSFPFAFEPASIYSPAEADSGHLDMSAAFSEYATPDLSIPSAVAGRFAIIDGGVLDNIPVAAAIQAISDSPADGPTDRWLTYLNPDPTDGPAPSLGGQQILRAVPSAVGAILDRFSQESVLTDIEDLDGHNREARRRQLRLRAAYAPLLETTAGDPQSRLAKLAEMLRPTNARVRARVDADALVTLLRDPRDRADGLLGTPVIGDPLAGFTAQAQQALPSRLGLRFEDSAAGDPAAVFNDIPALGKAIELCISWARELEEWAEESALAGIGHVKRAMYRLHLVQQVLAEYMERRALRAALDRDRVDAGELDEWLETLVIGRYAAQHQLPDSLTEDMTQVLDCVRNLKVADQQYQARIGVLADALAGLSVLSDPEPGSLDACDLAWQELERLANLLAVAAPARQSDTIADPNKKPELLGYALLDLCPDERRREVLRELLVLNAPLLIDSAPTQDIHFLRLASDAQTPLPFETLLATQGNGTDKLTVGGKLCGAELGAFSGFFSARWRANDWMWGRMDAATSMVALMVDGGRLRHAHRDPKSVFEDIQDLVTSTPQAELGRFSPELTQAWKEFLAGRWELRSSDVRDEITALFAAPDDEHPLTQTKAAVLERLHWPIVAAELPFIAEVNRGAHPGKAPEVQPLEPQVLTDRVREYAIGTENVRDLGEQRVGRVSMRLALATYRAMRPGSSAFAKRALAAVMALVKPLVLLGVLLFATPRRALLAASVAVAGLVCSAWQANRLESLEGLKLAEFGPTNWTVSRFLALLACLFISGAGAVLLKSTLKYNRGSGVPGRGRPVLPVVLTILVPLLGIALAGCGLQVGPWVVPGIAVVVVWLGTFWMRPLARLLISVLAVPGVYGATYLLFDWRGWPLGWWIVVSIFVVGYVLALLVSALPVLPPRPRPATN
ncbi:patatin-like protein [Pseudonocardiaceae bacterium YIM PH 21723]|nr:patatin-like protein [Pseudonocardiaceae bacterium YIM PH 21723]